VEWGANKSVLVLVKNKKKFGECEGKGNKSYVKGPSRDAVKLLNPTHKQKCCTVLDLLHSCTIDAAFL
jgi:hypothetical protein